MENPVGDLQGVGRLAVDGVIEVTDLVESLHRSIATIGGLIGPADPARSAGITALVYSAVRKVAGGVGSTFDAALAPLTAAIGELERSAERDALVAVLNGVVGDHLEASGNPLAISMKLRWNGEPLDPSDEEFRRALREAGGRIAVLVHGSCQNDRQWRRNGHDHGVALARDHDIVPVYLRYNSGLHISENGSELAELLEKIVDKLPGEVDLSFIGHSMGGLVARSACHYARTSGAAWLHRLEHLVCLGSPHHGAPLERYGNWIDNALEWTPYTAPLARLGRLRSAGVTDLRFGNLLHSDWQGRDRFEWSDDPREPVPLPDGVECYAIAAVATDETGGLSRHLPGDGLVPVESALGHHEAPRREVGFPESHQSVIHDTQHLELLDDPEVYAQLEEWLRS